MIYYFRVNKFIFIAWELKVELLLWFRWKNYLGRLRKTQKGKQQNKLIKPIIVIFVSSSGVSLQNENTALLWIIATLVASNWSQITFFILSNLLTSISERFWPNFDQINIPLRPAAIFFTCIVHYLVWQNSPEGWDMTKRVENGQ